MKKALTLFLALMVTLSAAPGLAKGVTLKTTSTFAGADAAAEIYVNMLKVWQEKTGNTVVDTSATSSETWKNGVLNDFAAGNEADVLFFFAKTTDSNPILQKVVPISEINAAYPDLHLLEDPAIAEEDGVVYAIPVRPFWEGLFCNTDLFEAHGLELPTTWEKLETAIKKFNEVGIVPISVSLGDVPHYIVEFCILSAGPPEDYMARPAKGEPVPQSWTDGMRLLRRLYQLSAFPTDVTATTQSATSQMFREKRAAMQIDGSWFANGIPVENMNTTIVLPFPGYAEDAAPSVCISGVSMGFYVSRAAWEDPAKRDAAVDLLALLTTGDNAAALSGYSFFGRLQESANQMIETSTTMNPPIQDAMDPEARAYWFSSIPGIVEGATDPAGMWAQVMAMDPFRQR